MTFADRGHAAIAKALVDSPRTPISISMFAGMSVPVTVSILDAMRRKGLVAHGAGDTWSLTERGRMMHDYPKGVSCAES
ncbi:hypothetical protein AXK57_21725 [Tsukamurella pulmonis]|uniref:hypothetical protein n=1 Tax=Tsukamurella pulmonis TaxID=47312 RepID=UPI000793C619|nr:hypothetical protein [Tsukamurella pulmonis]KXP11654.1 hypothetical protein AXK57_21725 [Tsukamurella pulmonis]